MTPGAAGHRTARELMRARRPAAVAVLAIGIVYLVLPQSLRLGPSWLMLAVVAALLASVFLAHVQGNHRLAYWLSRAVTAVVTLAIALSVVFLVVSLRGSKTPGFDLLRVTGLLWATNIAVFALWYWELDGGGPAVRRPGHYRSTDLVFPQFQQDPAGAAAQWSPGFIDYLFLAFNTSTAFSPTDTLLLSQRAKLLMMAQSIISLLVIAVLAARAINTI